MEDITISWKCARPTSKEVVKNNASEIGKHYLFQSCRIPSGILIHREWHGPWPKHKLILDPQFISQPITKLGSFKWSLTLVLVKVLLSPYTSTSITLKRALNCPSMDSYSQFFLNQFKQLEFWPFLEKYSSQNCPSPSRP